MFSLGVALIFMVLGLAGRLLDDQDYDRPAKLLNQGFKTLPYIGMVIIIACFCLCPMKTSAVSQDSLEPFGQTIRSNRDVFIRVDNSYGQLVYSFSTDSAEMSSVAKSGDVTVVLQLDDGPPQVITEKRHLAIPWMAWMFGYQTDEKVVVLRAPRDSVAFTTSEPVKRSTQEP